MSIVSIHVTTRQKDDHRKTSKRRTRKSGKEDITTMYIYNDILRSSMTNVFDQRSLSALRTAVFIRVSALGTYLVWDFWSWRLFETGCLIVTV